VTATASPKSSILQAPDPLGTAADAAPRPRRRAWPARAIDEVDALVDRADDVTPEHEQGRTLLGFDREATSLTEALVSALRDVEAAGLVVGSVRSEDLVTLKEIASRTGRTYESVRLLAAGKRGPGGFPGPMSSAGWTLYSWA